jgi:hypothetical protein
MLQMKITKVLISLVFASSVASTAVVAAGDSSAMDSSAIAAIVEKSSGVVIRVPVNAEGRELIVGAEMRVVEGVNAPTAGSLVSAWSTGADMTKAPQMDSSTDSDSSTSLFGWNHWYNNNWGWNHGYYNSYYSSYQPVYNNYGYSYSYGSPVYYNVYQPFNYNYLPTYSCSGYGYYYYPRYGW